MKMLKLLAIGILPASSLLGNLIMNPDFSADPASNNWLIFADGEQPVANFVTFAAPVATFTNTSGGEANFYQEFAGSLTPGVTYTFSVDIANLDFAGGGEALVWSKGFNFAYGWLNEFPNAAAVQGTNSIEFTPTGDGTNIYQVGVLFTAGSTGSSLDFSNPTMIPEPSTYALLLGVLGLAFVIYRRRRQ